MQIINHFEKGSEIITQGCEENSTILYGTAHGMKFGVIISIIDWQSANCKYKICPSLFFAQVWWLHLLIFFCKGLFLVHDSAANITCKIKSRKSELALNVLTLTTLKMKLTRNLHKIVYLEAGSLMFIFVKNLNHWFMKAYTKGKNLKLKVDGLQLQ